MRLVFALVAVVALVVGCTPEAVESPTPTPSPVETTVTPSESPTVEPPSPSPSPSPTVFQSYPADLPTEDPETAAIIEGWQEYNRIVEKYLSDPNGYSDFTETQIVTTGEEQNGILDTIQLYREHDIRARGGLTFDQLSLGEPMPTGEAGNAQVTVSYCVDRRDSYVETYGGEEFPTDHLVPRFQETATMEEGLDGIWRVAQIRNSEEPC